MRGWLVLVLGFASERVKYSEGNLQAQKNYCREPMYSASGINRDINVTLWEKRHYTFLFPWWRVSSWSLRSMRNMKVKSLDKWRGSTWANRCHPAARSKRVRRRGVVPVSILVFKIYSNGYFLNLPLVPLSFLCLHAFLMFLLLFCFLSVFLLVLWHLSLSHEISRPH